MTDVRALARLLSPLAALLLASVVPGCATDPSSPVDTTGTAGQGGSTAGSSATAASGGNSPNVGGSTAGDASKIGDPLSLEERCQRLDSALGISRPSSWVAASHCKEAEPDYAQVFGPEIRRLDLVITPGDYYAMQQDLAELTDPGPVGATCDGQLEGDPCTDDFGGGAGFCTFMFGEPRCYVAPPASETEPCYYKQEPDACTVHAQPGHCFDDGFTLVCYEDFSGEPMLRDVCEVETASCDFGSAATPGSCTQSGRLLMCQGPLDHVGPPPTPLEAAIPIWSRDPQYFDVTVRFDGSEWTHVGYRYESDDGLGYGEPSYQPFRLDLDQLEDQYPETLDQRLFGFEQLSFARGGITDPTYVRQVVTSEMFARAGVPAPRSTLVSVYLDKGEGAELLGLYSMTEVPGAPLTRRLFDDEKGSLYEPDGLGAHLLEYHPESFHERSDGCPPDQTDVRHLIDVLNQDMTDRALWRQKLSQAVDVPALIRFFATNQANGNWDTYGTLAHNYFLYGKTSGGPLHFIPWDFCFSLEASGYSDFSLDSFGGEWPLIQAVARDAELYSAYHVALEEIARREYDEGLLVTRVAELTAQVRPLLELQGASVDELDEFDFFVSDLQITLEAARDSLHVYLDSRGFSPDSL